MEIIFDANFLIYATKYKLFWRIEDHYPKDNWVIPIQVINELKHLKEKLTLDIIRKYNSKEKITKPDLGEGHTDDIIFEYAKFLKAKNKKVMVATMDKELIDKLKKAKIGIIIIRQKKILEEI